MKGRLQLPNAVRDFLNRETATVVAYNIRYVSPSDLRKANREHHIVCSYTVSLSRDSTWRN
ncbi:hypothetical protein OH77DRAFT_622388 [Trametes cingulata]|nr:hypothetical protein OH77DRAFT_622388 [Trametes cingulata]